MLKVNSKLLNILYILLLFPAFMFFSFSLLSLGSELSEESSKIDVVFRFVLYNSISIFPLTIVALVSNNLEKLKVKIPDTFKVFKDIVLILPFITLVISLIYLFFI